MHLMYIDESGSTGKDLKCSEQPIFTMAAILVSDEKWRLTENRVKKIMRDAFGGVVPENFELHARELLSPRGAGPFKGWERERRNRLALDLLSLLDERRHHVLLQIIHKSKMSATPTLDKNYGFDWKDPWEVSFHILLTMFEEFLRGPMTGRTSSGLVIIDHEQDYLNFVREHCKRRHQGRGWIEIRKVVEIGYSATSHANPMIQLTDLVAFTTKKWAESKTVFGQNWTQNAHIFLQECYDSIWARVKFKRLMFNKLNVPSHFVDYLKEIRTA